MSTADNKHFDQHAHLCNIIRTLTAHLQRPYLGSTDAEIELGFVEKNKKHIHTFSLNKTNVFCLKQ